MTVTHRPLPRSIQFLSLLVITPTPARKVRAQHEISALHVVELRTVDSPFLVTTTQPPHSTQDGSDGRQRWPQCALFILSRLRCEYSRVWNLKLATLTRRPTVDPSYVRSSGVPPTPTTPTSPGGGKSKKSNPLEDLINTEKTYVDCLTGIIRVRFDWLAFHQSLDADPCGISRPTESCSSMVTLQLAASRVRFDVPSRRGCLQGQS